MWRNILDNKLPAWCPIISHIILGLREIDLRKKLCFFLPNPSFNMRSMYISDFENCKNYINGLSLMEYCR